MTKKILNGILITFALIGLIITVVYFYYTATDTSVTVGVNNIASQTPLDLQNQKDLTDAEIEYYEKRVLFNVNYYSNENNNGIALQELRLDYFTDYTLSTDSCRSTGMQYIGNYENYVYKVDTEDEANDRVVQDFYYYDTVDFISWSGGNVSTRLNRDEKLTIRIGDKAYQIQLTKMVKHKWWILTTGITYYDWGNVFADVMQAVKTNSNGSGDWYITLDLSDYFTIYEFDQSTGKFYSDDVTDVIKNYAVLKFHYDKNGAVDASQSMFGLIENNRNYGKSDVNTDYWQERYVYTITKDDLILRQSETYGGKFASLDINIKQTISAEARTIINVNLDLTGSDIIGLDYNAFENLKINKLTIKKNGDFYLLDKALNNTNLVTLERSADTNLIFSDNVISTQYEEVVI